MARFAQGKFAVKNAEKFVGNKTPTYRSSWEFAFMKFCDENPNVTQWASEAIRIPYRNPLSGKYTIYVPDFFIQYVDKNNKIIVELIEVKPASQSILERVGKNKLQRVDSQCKITLSFWVHQQEGTRRQRRRVRPDVWRGND